MAATSTKNTVETKVSVGTTTIFGIATTAVGAVGAIVAGIEGSDTGLIVGGVATLLPALATLGGRFAQAVVIAREIARKIEPIVDVVAEVDDEAIDQADEQFSSVIVEDIESDDPNDLTDESLLDTDLQSGDVVIDVRASSIPTDSDVLSERPESGIVPDPPEESS